MLNVVFLFEIPGNCCNQNLGCVIFVFYLLCEIKGIDSLEEALCFIFGTGSHSAALPGLELAL